MDVLDLILTRIGLTCHFRFIKRISISSVA